MCVRVRVSREVQWVHQFSVRQSQSRAFVTLKEYRFSVRPPQRPPFFLKGDASDAALLLGYFVVCCCRNHRRSCHCQHASRGAGARPACAACAAAAGGLNRIRRCCNDDACWCVRVCDNSITTLLQTLALACEELLVTFSFQENAALRSCEKQLTYLHPTSLPSIHCQHRAWVK